LFESNERREEREKRRGEERRAQGEELSKRTKTTRGGKARGRRSPYSISHANYKY
jgi:hypothetical protein